MNMNLSARTVLGVLALLLLAGSGVAMLHKGVYGWTLFVLIPVCLGGLSAASLQPSSAAGAAGTGVVGMLVACSLLLLVNVEGIVCVAMAPPITLPLGAFGGWLLYRAEQLDCGQHGASVLLLLPATLTCDLAVKPPVFAVRTAIMVNARPEQVWKHVVTFSELPEPKEWYFHAGLAYPKRARIVGQGVGAVRYCEFSTGPFVEPIEVWNEGRLLRFHVTENPAPLQEWGLYGPIGTRHLHGYLVSKRGQFRLTPMADGKTLLEGTTWYQHGFWPAQYWRWWSDAIIHRIHLRVLDHVRRLSEADALERAKVSSAAHSGYAQQRLTVL